MLEGSTWLSSLSATACSIFLHSFSISDTIHQAMVGDPSGTCHVFVKQLKSRKFCPKLPIGKNIMAKWPAKITSWLGLDNASSYMGHSVCVTGANTALLGAGAVTSSCYWGAAEDCWWVEEHQDSGALPLQVTCWALHNIQHHCGRAEWGRCPTCCHTSSHHVHSTSCCCSQADCHA